MAPTPTSTRSSARTPASPNTAAARCGPSTSARRSSSSPTASATTGADGLPTDVPIRGDMIRLGQLLKLAGVVGAGGEAEARRGRQLHPGDEVRVAGEVLRVVAEG